MAPNPKIWTQDFLWKKREEMDPMADEVVARIISHHRQEAFHLMYKTLIRNDGVKYDLLPPMVKDYFETGLSLPDYADPAMVEAGEEVFERHGPMMSMLLFYKSMTMAYSCGRGAKVLHSTGRLGEQGGDIMPFTRRLMETAQFVVNVMSEGGLKPGGKGIITALKVRLIHASIRYYLKEGGWDTPHYGEPINQEDMAGTLLSFSALILEGLEQLDVELTQDEKEAYFHAWRVVGHFMGVDPDLIPANAEDGSKLGHLIFDQQLLASQAGVDLTKALLDFSHAHMKEKVLREVPEAMIHYLLGDQVAAAIGIQPEADLTERIVDKLMGSVFRHHDKNMDKHGIMTRLGEHLKVHMLQGSIDYLNQSKNIHFYLPPSLQERWLT